MKLSSMIGVTCFGLLLGSQSLALAHQQTEAEQKIAKIRSRLMNRDRQIRVDAANEIAQLGSAAASAVNDLIAMIETDNFPEVRIAAINAIRSIYFQSRREPSDGKAVKALVGALRNDVDPLVRLRACDSLGAIGKAAFDAAPALLEVMTSKDDNGLREPARRSLYSVAGPDCKQIVPILMEMHKKGIPDQANEATILTILGKIGVNDEMVLPLLVRVAQDLNPKHAESRRAAIRGLGYLGANAEPAVPILVEMLKHRRNPAKSAPTNLLVDALGRIGPGASPALPLLDDILLDVNTNAALRASVSRAVKLIKTQPKPL